jgi:hypothetical protein
LGISKSGIGYSPSLAMIGFPAHSLIPDPVPLSGTGVR